MIDALSPAVVAEFGAAEISARVRARALDPMDVARVALERIEATEPTLRAFISVDRAPALASDDCDGLLAGVPVAIKDNLDVAGLRTTAGSRVLGHAGRKANFDAAAVARWRAAGALIVGKTNLHEFACGATGVNSRWSTSANPWDSRCIPGGSSSGSAVAVAAHQVPLALGTDAAGSIRMPASLCGIVGLNRPDPGRFQWRQRDQRRYWNGARFAGHRYARFDPRARRAVRCGRLQTHRWLSWTMDQVGLLAASVGDAADIADALLPDRQLRSACSTWADGMHLGVCQAGFTGVSAEVNAAVRANLDALGVAGVSLVEIEVPSEVDFELANAAGLIISRAEALEYHRSIGTDLERVWTETADQLYAAQQLTLHEYLDAQRFRTELADRTLRAMTAHDLDALVMPTTLVTAPLVEDAEKHFTALSRNAIPWSLIGWPVVLVPCGRANGALPIGLQVVTPPGEDGQALHVARAMEAEALCTNLQD